MRFSCGDSSIFLAAPKRNSIDTLTGDCFYPRLLPGSATIRPPRTVAPITTLALMSTRFLMMYYPSNVGIKGKTSNVSSGNKTSGVSVPSISTYRRSSVRRGATFVRRPKPIRDSQVANTGKLRDGGTRPKVSASMVLPASPAAGDSPGKNFNAPNHRNTTPKLTRIKLIAWCAIQPVITGSIRLNNPRHVFIRRFIQEYSSVKHLSPFPSANMVPNFLGMVAVG